MDERAATDLAAIKAREAAVRDAIRRREQEVDMQSFGLAQLRLEPVVADEWGRLWIIQGRKLISVDGAKR